MIIIIFVDVMREQYIAKHSWRDSIIIGLLSLTVIVLFIVAKVDEMEPWLWLLGIVVAINGILFYRNYQKRNETFCINSDGIYVESIPRTTIPWFEVKSCYFAIDISTFKYRTFWSIKGCLFINIFLVVEKKHGYKEKVKLNPYRFNMKRIAESIDRYSGKALFNKKESYWYFIGPILLYSALFLVFLILFFRFRS